MSTFNVITKREECVGAKSYAVQFFQPSFLFFAGKRFRFFSEEVFPNAICQNIFVVIGNVNIDGVVAVRTADICFERQCQNFRILTQPPNVCFVTSKTSAVYARLLTCTDTDCLTVFNIANGVRLGVFQSNQSNQQIASCCFGNFFINGRTVNEHISGNFCFVTILFKSNAKYIFSFGQTRNIVRINFDYIISTVAFGFEDFHSFFGIARSDYAVRNFTSKHGSSFFIANIGQSYEVTIGAHTVSTTSTSVSSCKRRKFQIVNIVDFFQSVAHRHSYCCTCRANVFEGSSCGQTGSFFQFFN